MDDQGEFPYFRGGLTFGALREGTVIVGIEEEVVLLFGRGVVLF